MHTALLNLNGAVHVHWSSETRLRLAAAASSGSSATRRLAAISLRGGAKLDGAVLFARRQMPGGILAARQREVRAAGQSQQRSIPLVDHAYEVAVKTVHRRTSNPQDEEPGPDRHHSILP